MAPIATASSDRTRDRVLNQAMRLFGEQGYASTTIAEIEAAAGLSPGSGALYRHFPSKRALLEEGVRHQIEEGEDLAAFVGDREAFAALPLRERILALARAGLGRLDEERDLSRLMVRDLARFPDLLEQVREQDVRRVNQVLAGWLAAEAGPAGADRDWQALTAVLVGALVHYWILLDVFGTHPDGVDEDRYLAALADMAEGLLTRPDPC